jgi:prophage DNA circulation protein
MPDMPLDVPRGRGEGVSCLSEMVSCLSEMVSCLSEMVSRLSEMVSRLSEMVSRLPEMLSCLSEMVSCLSDMLSGGDDGTQRFSSAVEGAIEPTRFGRGLYDPSTALGMN